MQRLVIFILCLLTQPTLSAADLSEQRGYAVGSLPGQLTVEQGVANYSVPIGLPPGIAGMEPELGFNYSSRSGSGPMGMGWSLSGTSAITRCGHTLAQDGSRLGVRWLREDRLCLDGQRLILVSGHYGASDSVYRTEMESFSRITAKGQRGQGPAWFRVETKAGQTIEYGRTDNSRIVAGTRTEVFAWAQNRVTDAVNNHIDFEYRQEKDLIAYRLTRIRYADDRNSVRLIYSLLPDTHARSRGFLAGVGVGQSYQLDRLETRADGKLVSLYRLAYRQGTLPLERHLSSITLCAAKYDSDPLKRHCLPPLRFEWTSGEQELRAKAVPWQKKLDWPYANRLSYQGGQLVDLQDMNGDGLVDKIISRDPDTGAVAGLFVMLNNGDGFDDPRRWLAPQSVSWANSFSLTVEGKQYLALRDMDGDGLPDRVVDRLDPVTQTAPTGLYVSRNRNPGFSDPSDSWHPKFGWGPANLIHYAIDTTPFRKPAQYDAGATNVALIDMNGDARPDKVVDRNPHNGTRDGLYVMLNTGEAFAQPTRWYDRPLQSWAQHIDHDHRLGAYNSAASMLVQMLDMNGDGLTDKVFGRNPQTNAADGFYVSLNDGKQLLPPVKWHQAFAFSEANKASVLGGRMVQLRDINGDGLPDKLFDRDPRVAGGTGGRGLYVSLNTGDGFVPVQRWHAAFAVDQFNYLTDQNQSLSRFMDVNGDGLPDRVFHRNPDNASQHGLYVLLNTGRGFIEPKRWLQSTGTDWADTLDHEDGLTRLIDINGDGMPEKLISHDPENLGGFAAGTHAWLNRNLPPMITRVVGSLGETIEIAYKPGAADGLHLQAGDSEYPEPAVPIGWSVASTWRDNGLSRSIRTDYRYGGARIDLTGRGFLGVDWEEATDSSNGQRTTTWYRQDFPFAGMPRRIVTKKADGKVLSDSILAYQAMPMGQGKRHFVYLTKKTDLTYELDGAEVSRVTTRHEDYDQFGNVGKVVVVNDAGEDRFVKTTRSEYANHQESWHLGRLKRSSVIHEHRRKGADGFDLVDRITRTSAFSYNSHGLLETETIEPDFPALRMKTEYVYDDDGNRHIATVSGQEVEPRTTTTTYDPSGRFVERVENALSHRELREYDPRFGKRRVLTGPNDLTTRWDYDDWGRQVAEHRDDGTATLIQREWVPAGDQHAPERAVYRVSEHGPVILDQDGSVKSSAGRPTFTYHDRLGRTIRKLSTGFDGSKVYQDTRFDRFGREEASSLPYFADQVSYWVSNTYDELNRVTRKRFTSEHQTLLTEIQYLGLTTIETRGLEGQAKPLKKTTRKNGQGKVVEVIEELGARVSYEYDAVGNLLQTDQHDDINGNTVTTQLRYDRLGRKTDQWDPDMGHWRYGYNVYGELRHQTDAKGQTIEFHYDRLGRRIERNDAGSSLTEWFYDSAPDGIGKLAEVRQTSLENGQLAYQQLIGYDPDGRVSDTRSFIESEWFLTATDYDQYGRVYRTYRPGGFQVRNLYNRHGFLLAKQSPKWRIDDWDIEHLVGLKGEAKQGIEAAVQQIEVYRAEYQWLIDRADFYINEVANLVDNKRFAAGHKVPEDERGYRAFRKKSGELYFETRGQNPSTHYHLVQQSNQRWTVATLNHATWLSLKPDLEDLRREAYIGDADGDGQRDFRLVALSSNDGVVDGITAEKLLQLAEDVRTAAHLLGEQIDDVLALAEELLTVAESIDDRIRQASYWQEALDPNDLEAIINNANFTTWWRATARDAAGRLVGQRAGNGLVTIRDYDPATGQLDSIQSGFEYGDTSLVRHVDYLYDENDNVTFRSDLVQGMEESFDYDRLNRLKSSRVDGFFDGNTYHTKINYAYDALGNLLRKSNVSAEQFVYGVSDVCGKGKPVGPHALRYVPGAKTSAPFAQGCYSYDANGSMTAGGGRSVDWTVFNKPSEISNENGRIEFRYGPKRNRYLKREHLGGAEPSSTTVYLGKTYERERKPGGATTHKYFIHTEDGLAAIYTEQGDGQGESHYLHRDALGSVDTITNAEGKVIKRMSYQAFGARRWGSWRSPREIGGINLDLPTNRGFTGHEHLDDMGLIHMNGRVYDPVIGRFLSADPHVQFPHNSQSYNRYTYVLNNPMKYTDPSGYWSLKKFLGKLISPVAKVIARVPILRTVVTIVGCSFGPAACAATVGTLNFAATGNLTSSFKAAAIAFISVKVAHEIGHGAIGDTVGGTSVAGVDVGRTIAHGVSQGIFSVASGGEFRDGFYGAVFGHVAGGMAKNHFNGNWLGDTVEGRTVVAAIVGGTAASMGGGKFANGAITAAFVHLYNGEWISKEEGALKLIRSEGAEWWEQNPDLQDGFSFALDLASIPFKAAALLSDGLTVYDISVNMYRGNYGQVGVDTAGMVAGKTAVKYLDKVTDFGDVSKAVAGYGASKLTNTVIQEDCADCNK